MRLIGLIVSAVLAVSVVAEGAYIVHTRRQVAHLADRLDAIGSEAGDLLTAASDSRPAGRLGEPSNDGAPELRRAGRVPPPRLVKAPTPLSAPAPASDNPLPLPPALDNPEAREQLRKFVLAQLDLERQEQRQRFEQQREEREQQRRDRMAKDLGLSPAETEKFNQIMSQIQNARAALRDRIESGQLARENIGGELAAMRDENQKQMRSLLGDDRMKKFEDMRGRMGGGPGGGPGPNGPDGMMQGGGRRWGGGGRFNQPGGGPPGAATPP
jgi:hypothetical protein